LNKAPVGRFPTTRWTLILAAREGEEARRVALEEVLRAYWKPVYFYVRRKGLDAEAAQDAVQDLFLLLLERDFLERVDPSRGRLRSYLRKAADHYLVDRHEREVAIKRGGGVRFVPLELPHVESELAVAPQAPELAFDREWAVEVMERALSRLRQDYDDGKRHGDVETIFRFFRLNDAPSYQEAAADSGMSVPQFKAALHRARVRLRQLLREEVADTLEDSGQTDGELSHLLRVLSG
jgi:RNA polymerase sigma-70 factor (ECF subfamily)